MADDIQLMDGEFKFLIPLAKATQDDGGALFVEGIASDTGMDLMEERISLQGQESMVKWARAGKVVLGGEADHFAIAFDDDLGTLVDGAVTDKGQFYIKSQLDPDNSRAVTLHTSLKKGKKLGLSVFGKITEFHDEEGIPVIDGVRLTRVMVTPSPANPRTWLADVAKSLPINVAQKLEADQGEPVETGTPVVSEEDTAVARMIKDVNSEVAPPEVAKKVDLEAAKGLFLDALRQAREQAEAMAPFDEQLERMNGIDELVGLLFGVAWNVYDALDWGETTPEEAAVLLGEAIDEFKMEVVSKSLPAEGASAEGDGEIPAEEILASEEVTPEGAEVSESGDEPPAEQVEAEEGEPPAEHAAPIPANVTPGGVGMEGKSLSEIAQAFADDKAADMAGIAPQVVQPAPQVFLQAAPQSTHPSVMVAATFTDAVRQIVDDGGMSPDQKREAVTLALAATMQQLDNTLPSTESAEDTPAWARKMFARIDALEMAFQKSANVGAVAPSPEPVDSPAIPVRKSVPPDLQPSTVVQREQTLRDVALQLIFGSVDPLTLP